MDTITYTNTIRPLIAESAASLARIKQWVGEGGWILKKNKAWTEAERRVVTVPR